MARIDAFVVLLLLPALSACEPPPQPVQAMPAADTERGRLAMARAGCGACHAIDGVWPRGNVASALRGLSGRALIAGRVPNRPAQLAGFIRNAPAYAPDAGMPAMPLSASEAHDAAAYLYSLD